MTTLLLRLAAPRQSWGGPATQRWRPTEKVPTRTGLEGMLGACLGLGYGKTEPRIAELRMHVRVDRPGTVEDDFHTVSPPPADIAHARRRPKYLATGRGRTGFTVPLGSGIPWKLAGTTPVLVTHRLYLADAEFLLAVDGEHIEELSAAVHDPVFTPFLGRKAFAPQFPFHLGLRSGDGLDVLSELPTCVPDRALPILRIDRHRAAPIARVRPPHTTSPLEDWKSP